MKLRINFLRYRHLFVGISLIFCIGAVVGFFTKGFNYGIDFTGGVEFTVTFKQPITSEEIEKALTQEGYRVEIQSVVAENPRFFIRVASSGSASDHEQKTQEGVSNFLKQTYGDNLTIDEALSISSVVSNDNQRKVLWAIFWCSILIFIYVAFRFKYQYAIATLLSLFHDLLVMSFFIVFMKIEFNIFTITAYLTIFGYSINDTIVLFDRVREYAEGNRFNNMYDIINESINDVFSRTIITSLLTFFVVVSLFAFSQGTIKDMAFNLMVGIIAGTYSTIYIACASLLFISKFRPVVKLK